jgi:hypothetical protein
MMIFSTELVSLSGIWILSQGLTGVLGQADETFSKLLTHFFKMTKQILSQFISIFILTIVSFTSCIIVTLRYNGCH